MAHPPSEFHHKFHPDVLLLLGLNGLFHFWAEGISSEKGRAPG